MSTLTARAAPARPRATWLAPAGLILLALIPLLAGAMRLTELAGSPVATAANARFLDSPVPVITHIVSVTVFSLLGAFQFVPGLRRRGARWHWMAGSILIPAGLLTALSGMWMAVFYPHPAGDGFALVILRLLFGAATPVRGDAYLMTNADAEREIAQRKREIQQIELFVAGRSSFLATWLSQSTRPRRAHRRHASAAGRRSDETL